MKGITGWWMAITGIALVIIATYNIKEYNRRIELTKKLDAERANREKKTNDYYYLR
jgi:hypothetical protein